MRKSSLKTLLIKGVKLFDMSSVNLGFKIKGKDQYGTFWGGFIFIMYFSLTIYFIITYFISFINRSTFNQNTIENHLDHAPKLNFLEDKMAFAFGFTVENASNNHLINTLKININLVTITKSDSKKTKTPISLTKCTKAHFHNKIDEDFDNIHLENYYCIDREQYTKPLYLEGIHSAEIFQYLEYSMFANSTLLNEELKAFILYNQIKMVFYYLDSSINISDYHMPEKLYMNNIYLQLSFAMTHKYNIYFANNTFINDVNILLPTESSFNFYKPLLHETMFEFIGEKRFENSDLIDEYNVFGKIYIRSSPKSITMKRVYQKFSEFLAEATAIVSQLLFILMTIIGAYDKFCAEECIIDNIMRYKEKLIKKSPSGYGHLKKSFQQPSSKISSNDNTSQACTIYCNTKMPQHPFFLPQRRTAKVLTLNMSSKTNEKNLFSQDNDQRELNTLEPLNVFPIKKNNYPYHEFLSENLQIIVNDNIKRSPLKKTMKMKYSFCDVMKSLGLKLGCKTDIELKKHLYQKGKEYFVHNVDFFTYFMKMREIELIKYFIFDTNEISMIDFLSKPSISTVLNNNEDAPIHYLKNEFNMSMKTIQNLSDSFNQLYQKYQNSKFKEDEKLIKFLKQISYEIYQLLH